MHMIDYPLATTMYILTIGVQARQSLPTSSTINSQFGVVYPLVIKHCN